MLKKSKSKLKTKPKSKVKTKVKKKSPLFGWYFMIENDANYPDNANVTFIKPAPWDTEKKIDEIWTKAESNEISYIAEKLIFDKELVMSCVYSFDTFTQDMVRTELKLVGLSEVKAEEVDLATLLMEMNSNLPKDSDDNDCSGCNSP